LPWREAVRNAGAVVDDPTGSIGCSFARMPRSVRIRGVLVDDAL
jgi:hypothetical protein